MSAVFPDASAEVRPDSLTIRCSGIYRRRAKLQWQGWSYANLQRAYNCVYLEFLTLSLVESGVELCPRLSIGENRLR